MLHQLTVSSVSTAREQNDVPAFFCLEYIDWKIGGYPSNALSEDALAFYLLEFGEGECLKDQSKVFRMLWCV
jgi:hypothetical protein